MISSMNLMMKLRRKDYRYYLFKDCIFLPTVIFMPEE